MSDFIDNNLPGSWAVTTLGEITTDIVDKSGPKNGDHFLYVDISSIDNEKKQITEPKLLPVSEAPSRAKQHLQPQDVTVSMTRPNLNAIAIIPSQMEDAIGSTGLHILRSTTVNPFYIYYWVQTQSFIKGMTDLVLGVLYPAVRPDDIRNSKIPLAPFPEQHRIVEEIEKQFSRLDAGVAALKRVQANLKRYRASVLKAACEGRLVPTEAELAKKEGRDYEPADVLLQRILEERGKKWEENELAKMRAKGKEPKDESWKAKYKEPAAPDTSDLPELPEGWGWATVEQLAILVTDGDHNPPPRVESGIPHLTARNIIGSRIHFDNCTFITEEDAKRVFSRYEPLARDVIITCVGTVGRTAIVPEGAVFSPDRNLAAIRLPVKNRLVEYLELCLKSPYYQDKLTTVSGSTAQPHLYLGDLRQLAIPIPPHMEVPRIVTEVERCLSILEQIELAVDTNLKRAEKLRQAILKQAFEGKLVPQDANDDPQALE